LEATARDPLCVDRQRVALVPGVETTLVPPRRPPDADRPAARGARRARASRAPAGGVGRAARWHRRRFHSRYQSDAPFSAADALPNALPNAPITAGAPVLLTAAAL